MSDEEVWTPFRCNECRRLVLVDESAAASPWIDPDLYACPECRRAARHPELEVSQLSLFEFVASERPEYDPAMAAIPF